jgi:nitrite reductase/ring-hydroxylating ferredoxin subunit
LRVIPVPEPPVEGERVILESDEDGPSIIVANVAGEYFATDAKCPHLGLPMKRAKINPSGPDNAPEIVCNFHNSCFNMKTGKCNKWVTGALGVQNKFISGVMSKVGSGEKDIKAYSVITAEDGTLSLEG